MISTGRLDKLFLALTAKERALLVLKAWKEGGDEDRLVRATMPDNQAPEFNRYIDLMNSVNQRIGVFVIMERSLVDQLGLRYGWLLTLKLWAMQDLHLACAFFARWREPIGESEHRVLQAEHKETIRPDWGMAYDVYPDGHEECAERARAAAGIIRDTLRKSPVVTDLPELFGGSRPPKEGTRSVREELWDAHVDHLTNGLVSRWAEMRAVEEVLAEVAVEFESEDPALPDMRSVLTSIRSDLLELRAQLSGYAGPIDLPADPDQDLVMKLRDIAGAADTNGCLGNPGAITREARKRLPQLSGVPVAIHNPYANVNLDVSEAEAAYLAALAGQSSRTLGETAGPDAKPLSGNGMAASEPAGPDH